MPHLHDNVCGSKHPAYDKQYARYAGVYTRYAGAWAYAAFGTGGVEILYKVTLCHADYAIRLIQRAGGGGGVLSA